MLGRGLGKLRTQFGKLRVGAPCASWSCFSSSVRAADWSSSGDLWISTAVWLPSQALPSAFDFLFARRPNHPCTHSHPPGKTRAVSGGTPDRPPPAQRRELPEANLQRICPLPSPYRRNRHASRLFMSRESDEYQQRCPSFRQVTPTTDAGGGAAFTERDGASARWAHPAGWTRGCRAPDR